MNKIISTAILALVMAFPAYAERDSIGFGVTAGTLGAGFTVATPINSILNARVLLAGLKVETEADGDDDDGVPGNELEFDGDVELGNIGALLDYHPLSNGLRLSTGLVLTRNRFEGEAVCRNAAGCEVGGMSGVVAQGDRVFGEVDYSGVAPYLGLGWGNSVDKSGRWSFSFDLGVMLTGSPDVSVECGQVSTPVPGAQATCDSQAEEEERELEDDIGDLDFYPVLSLGVAYRF